MTTLPLRKSIGRSACRRGFILITLTLTCLALLPTAQTIPEPTPPPEKRVEGDLGNHNTVEGNGLSALTTGTDNTAIGFEALFRDTTGSENTATGSQALLNNTGGFGNTATGFQALMNNIKGRDNTAMGSFALVSNTSGESNTAIGNNTLLFNMTGNNNIAIGFDALSNNTGNDNIALGVDAGANITTGDNNIDIGSFGAAGESGAIRIGDLFLHTAAYIAGISGTILPSGVPVVVANNGQLGVGAAASSVRFKADINPMDKASEAILALKPVTFRYKRELDPKGIPQFGLLAEDVEKVNPALVTRDAKGEVYTVRYDAVNAMLLNEFLKEHRKVQEQEATIAQLKKDFQATAAHQKKQIEALTAGLQKVSAQAELTKPAPQVVDNNQ